MGGISCDVNVPHENPLHEVTVNTSQFNRVSAWRALLVVVTMAVTPVVSAASQTTGERMTKAAQRFAAITAEVAMSKAARVDLETRGLATITMGAVTIGVSSVDLKDEVAVRAHIYFYNPSEQSQAIEAPAESTFVLLDDRGRRLQILSLRAAKPGPSANQLTIPALERVEFAAMYLLPTGVGPAGTLKVGSIGVIRCVPLHRSATPAPPAPEVAGAPPAGATPPACPP